MNQLTLFVATDCPSCVNAQQIAMKATRDFPSLNVNIVDVDQPDAVIPAHVFAVPTFCLGDRVISLGTPDWHQLTHQIRLQLTTFGSMSAFNL